MTMTRDEIRDWYMRARYDQWQRSQLKIGLDILEKISGVNRRLLRSFLSQEPPKERKNSSGFGELGQRQYDKLEDLIHLIDGRSILWYNKIIEYINPPEKRATRSKIGGCAGFTLFDLCSSCGGNKWLLGEIDGKPKVVCYSCLPPGQWGAVGIKQTGVNIIRVFLEGKSGEHGLSF